MWDTTGNSVVDHVDLLDPCWDQGTCRKVWAYLLVWVISPFCDIQLVRVKPEIIVLNSQVV